MVKSSNQNEACGGRAAGDQTKAKNPFVTDKLAKISSIAADLLGYPDRMLYRSKSMSKPTTIFNANVYNFKADKIWYGDLEIERDREALIELSNREGAIYILWEMDGRFLAQMPTLAYIQNRAIVIVKGGTITFNEEFDMRVKALIKIYSEQNRNLNVRKLKEKRGQSR